MSLTPLTKTSKEAAELKVQVAVVAELLTKLGETSAEDRTVEKTKSSTGIRRRLRQPKSKRSRQPTTTLTQKTQALMRNRSSREM
jgi:hypothetical protein